MSRLRILVLAPECDPERVSVPLVAYSQAEALAQLHDVTLVTRSRGEGSLRRARAPFRAIEVARMPVLERIYAWSLRRVFKYNFATQVLTVFEYPFSLVFEWRAWHQLKRRIFHGEFDVVLRLSPISPVLPSPFAFFLRKGPIPFVIGPVNGGLPWPPGFSQLEKQKEWVAGLRNFYRYMPFARSTYRHAAAVVAGSSQTYAEFALYREKLFFLPENGVHRSLCSRRANRSDRDGQLKLIFVAGLVPIKGCDLALRAAAPLLREGLASFTVVGDGPEREPLERLTRSLGVEGAVSFCGWLKHEEAFSQMQASDVLVFPSIRDRGPAVVYEALAAGAVPLVADFGGPGDIVRPGVGYKVPLIDEAEMVSQMEEMLRQLEGNRDLLEQLRQQGMAYARECLTWDAKAEALTAILRWTLRQVPRPCLPPPKALRLARAR